MTQIESEPPVGLQACVQNACDIASGKAPAPADDEGMRIVGAKKDYNSRGRCREHWFRMVLRDGTWRYVSTDRLPNENFRAADRNADVRGDVYHGEITITHDRGAGVDSVGNLEVRGPDGKRLADDSTDVAVAVTRDGKLKLTLPDGSIVVAPNPRGK